MGALDTAYKDLNVPPANGAPTVTPPPVPPVAAAKAAAGFDPEKQAPPPTTAVAPNTDAMARNIANGAESVAGMLNPANIKVEMAPRTQPPPRVDNSIISPGVDAAIVSGAQAADRGMTNFSNAAVDGAQRVGAAVKGALDDRFNPTSNYVGSGPTDPDTNARPNNKPIDLKDSVSGVYNRLIGNSAQSALESIPDYNAKNGVNFVADEGRMARTLSTNVFAPPAGAPKPPAPNVPQASYSNEGRVRASDISVPAAPTVTPAAAPAAGAPATPGPNETGPRAFTMANGQRMITNVDGNAAAAGMQPPGAPQPVLQNIGAAGSPFGGSAQQQLANIQALRGPEPAPQPYQPPQKSAEQLEREDRDHRWGMDNLRLAAERTPALAHVYAAQMQAMNTNRATGMQANTAAGGHAVQARGQDIAANTSTRNNTADNQTRIATTGMNNDTTVQAHGMDNATRVATTGMNNDTSLATTNLNNRSAQQVAGIQSQSHIASANINAQAHRDVETQRGKNQMGVEQYKIENAPAGYHAPALPGQAPVFTGAGGMYRYVDGKGNVINGRMPTKAELATKTK